ncbi:MAG: hypothetical protein FD131_1758 [Rhodocyclaceae bacterium]|nr:MAG: hypothetical protein FD131_1758 [Rhodocyclaceae bacterium]
MLGNINHGEIIGHEGLRQAGEGESDKQRHGRRGRTGDGNPGHAVLVGADQRQGAEDQGDQRSEDQGEMAEFGNHAQ